MSRSFVYVCELCGTELDENHCKARCPNCGRTLDCSDLPILEANAIVEDDGTRHARSPAAPHPVQPTPPEPERPAH